jgi:FlaG/FlaF family flagellin (archaellin)
MLMLVVTIIIAAVVSAFAGGATSGSQKAPTANVEFHLKNGGNSFNSYFTMKVLGVSDPIPTKNLRVITSWTTTYKDPADTTNYGKSFNGGNTTYAGMGGVYITGEQTGTTGTITVPTGYGNGVTEWANDTSHPPGAMWGNFSLSSGTSTYDKPSGYGTEASGIYFYGSSHLLDPMQALLGNKWNNLRVGDTVAVRIMDAKSGKTIVDQNVIVEG